MDKIENIELRLLSLKDYDALKAATKSAYKDVPNSHWEKEEIRQLIKIFPQGQVVILVNGEIAGSALSIIVKNKDLETQHTYDDVAGDEAFHIHSNDGTLLYGLDVFIKPEYRGLRLGRRLYDYRKELCESLNLKGIVFGGRIPNYHKYAKELTPKQYLDKVKRKEIEDPVLNFQLSNDFHPVRILKVILKVTKLRKNMLFYYDGTTFITPNRVKRLLLLRMLYDWVSYNGKCDRIKT